MSEFTTNLRCGACLEAVRPVLDAAPNVKRWSVDLDRPGRPIAVEGVTRAEVDRLLATAGYATTGLVTAGPAVTTAPEPAASYYPLGLIVAYLVGAVVVFELSQGTPEPMRAMRHFMAGFFLVFSFFKMLDLRAFADSYRMYDVVAARLPVYGLAYPFVELGLGVAYLADANPWAVNGATLVVMGVSLVGVLRAVLGRQRIRCACLGTVFNLPMSVVTVVEDGLMLGMAAAMLLMLPG